jgi:hypothetical protein
MLQSQNILVDWIEFAINREGYRKSVRVSKGKVVAKVDEEVGARMSTLGKTRCLTTTSPPLLKLTLKPEN